jgi:Ca-activated chloride channel family protein
MSIHTALNDELLHQIALETGGNYYYAGDENELKQIYRDLQPALSIRPEALELTSLLAGLSVLMILFAGGLSLLWFGRVL